MYKKIAKDLNLNQKKYTSYIVLIVVVILCLLYLFKDRPDDDKSKQTRWRIKTITAKQTQASPELQLYGTIINPFISRLKATIETYVDKVKIREGDYVNEGDILVELDKSEIELDVNLKKGIVDEISAKLGLEKEKYESDKKALAAEERQVKLTERNLDRQKSLREKRLNAQLNLDQAEIELEKIKITFYNRKLEVDSFQHRIDELQAQLTQAKSDYEKAVLDLDRTLVKAPFSGYISRLFVSPGSRIQPNETMLEVFNQDTIEIKIQVPQTTMEKLRKSIVNNEDIYASTEIFNTKYQLQFRNVTANQDVASGGSDAFFIFKDKEQAKEIKTIGKTVTVTLYLPIIENIFIIPTLSLHHNDRIYIVKNEFLKFVPVTIHGSIKRDGNEFLIISSDKLQNGDQILASVLPSAIDGLAVEIVNKKTKNQIK